MRQVHGNIHVVRTLSRLATLSTEILSVGSVWSILLIIFTHSSSSCVPSWMMERISGSMSLKAFLRRLMKQGSSLSLMLESMEENFALACCSISGVRKEEIFSEAHGSSNFAPNHASISLCSGARALLLLLLIGEDEW